MRFRTLSTYEIKVALTENLLRYAIKKRIPYKHVLAELLNGKTDREDMIKSLRLVTKLMQN